MLLSPRGALGADLPVDLFRRARAGTPPTKKVGQCVGRDIGGPNFHRFDAHLRPLGQRGAALQHHDAILDLSTIGHVITRRSQYTPGECMGELAFTLDATKELIAG